MKILLDENIPRKLKFNFDRNLELFTTQEMGWKGKKNGELLVLMIKNGFEAFITIDRNLQYQQNLSKLNLTIFVLNAQDNRISSLEPLIPKIKAHLRQSSLKKGLIEIGP